MIDLSFSPSYLLWIMFNETHPDSLILPARRRFLKQSCLGFGSVALASMLNEQRALGASTLTGDPLAMRPPLFAPKAKSVIWLFMTGAPSQVDTWDYKPELQKRNGEPLPGSDANT